VKNYSLPNPSRCRQIPSTFSWIDHRLVRDKHIIDCTREALSLYLFLVTVADKYGCSYYSDVKIMEYIPLDRYWIALARDELIHEQLIAYKEPVYQILPLDPPAAAPVKVNTPEPEPQSENRYSSPEEIKNILAKLKLRISHD